MNELKKIPLFPLELVLLPCENIPLHIFEPRYKKMISNSLNKNEPFGIVLKDSKQMFNIGCQAIVSKIIKTYPDGNSDILVKGINRFKIINTYKDDKIIMGEVGYLRDKQVVNKNLLTELNDNYLKILIKIGSTNLLDKDLQKSLSYEYIENMLLPLKVKKKLISTDCEEERIHIINKLFFKILSLPIEDINKTSAEA